MKRIIGIIGIAVVIVGIVGAQNPKLSGQKPGACPPEQPVNICGRSCHSDAHCEKEGKCCPTTCGGNICTAPVTQGPPPIVKPGSCPETPTGRWICTPTCTTDGDCRAAKKCCRNRCGVLACQKPDAEITEPVDMAYQPEPKIPDDGNSGDFNPNNPFLFSSN
ncbi:waprin-Phi1-like [Fopius arisanus]|uniref:WAP1 protein n=1 Tax=Fopius arisanus TaxID=64838 RepID=A0A0C9QP19_9HYME|nr:PREDICTED: waprin-Phi1-like [Fopius arisanus]